MGPRCALSLSLATAVVLAASLAAGDTVVDANHGTAGAVTSAAPPSDNAPLERAVAQEKRGAAKAGRAAWTDDFNRPDGTDMGPDWTEYQGDMAIFNNAGRGNLSTGWSYMLHNSATSPLTSAQMIVDLVPPLGSSGPHVALIMGAAPGSTNWLYTKLQDNDSSGDYDRVFFYSVGNGGGWGTSPSQPLTTPVSSARVFMYLSNGGDRLNVDIDNDFNGTIDQHYENDGALGVTTAGTGFGIGAWAMGSYDNWEANDSIPVELVSFTAD